MDYFSNNPNADKLNKVKSDLDQLQTYDFCDARA